MNSTSNSDNKNIQLKSNNLLVFLFRKAKVIIAVCVVAAIISIIASLVIEEKYRSTVTMYAAATNSIGRSFMKEDNQEDLMEMGETEQAEQLLQIINSHQIQEYIIDKYNLFEHYDIDSTRQGASSLINEAYSENINANLTKFGSVDVEVLDTSPDTAMLIANDIAEMVDVVTNRLKNDRAQQALNMAQEKLSELELEIDSLENEMDRLSELGVYDYFKQIEGLNEQYATAMGEGRPQEAAEIKTMMDSISQYGSKFQRLRSLIGSAYDREDALRGNYELLKIDVNSTIPAKFVVNRGQVADKKAYPVRWLIVVMSVVSAFVFTVIILLVFENFKRMKREELI